MATGAIQDTWNFDLKKPYNNYFEDQPNHNSPSNVNWRHHNNQEIKIEKYRPSLSNTIHEFQELLSNLIPSSDISIEQVTSTDDLLPLKSPLSRLNYSESFPKSSSPLKQFKKKRKRLPSISDEELPSTKSAPLNYDTSRSNSFNNETSCIRRICISRPKGFVGMQLYSPELLAISQNLKIFQNAVISNRQLTAIQPSQDWLKQSLVSSFDKLPNNIQDLPPVPTSKIEQIVQENPLYTSLPECHLDRASKELCVIWFENDQKQQKRFSCKRLSKKAVYEKAENFMLQVACRAFAEHNVNVPYSTIENITKQKLSFLNSQKDEIVYNYGGPFNTTLMYKKSLREWIVTWVVNGVQQSVKWSCKKLGKLEAITRAEKFVNSIADGNPNPESPKRKTFWKTDKPEIKNKRQRKSKPVYSAFF